MTVLFTLKMEQAVVIAVISLCEELHKPPVDVCAVKLHLEPAILFNAPVFADP